MEKVLVKVVKEDGVTLPEYQTIGSAGMDVRANIKKEIELQPLDRVLIPTGLKFGIPDGYEVQVRPRSGLAKKHGITVLNTPGTLDCDYVGEIGVILINLSRESYFIQPEERIAQLILTPVVQAEFEEVKSLEQTERGDGGFGHTGK